MTSCAAVFVGVPRGLGRRDEDAGCMSLILFRAAIDPWGGMGGLIKWVGLVSAAVIYHMCFSIISMVSRAEYGEGVQGMGIPHDNSAAVKLVSK
jgi:hypothetical protein